MGQERPEATRALVDAYLRASPADSAMRGLRLVLAGRRADADAAIAALGDYELGRLVYLLHLEPDGGEGTLAAFRRLAADGRGAAYYGDTITARRWLATELLHVGRPRDAARALGDDLPNRATLAFELALAGGVAPDDMRDVVALWWRRDDTRSLLAALPWLALARDTTSLVRLGDACTPARGRESSARSARPRRAATSRSHAATPTPRSASSPRSPTRRACASASRSACGARRSSARTDGRAARRPSSIGTRPRCRSSATRRCAGSSSAPRSPTGSARPTSPARSGAASRPRGAAHR